MWIGIAAALVGLVLLVFAVGFLLPKDYHARGYVDLELTPDELWTRLVDYERHPMAASMARSVQRLPAENGMPVWIEDIGSSKVRVRTVESESPTRLVRELADQVVPMTARVELRIEPHAGGCRVHLDNHTVVENGTWHVPIFRVLITLTGGIRAGMKAWLTQAAGGERVAFAWQ